MTESVNSNRRTFLTAAGAGSALAIAGCVGGLGGSSDDEDQSGNGGDGGDETSGNGSGTGSSDGAESIDPAKDLDVERVAADPRELPDPVDWEEPRRHEVEMTTTEVTAEIEPGVTFDYMTFDGRIPGPMVRVRRGDTVNFTLHNDGDNAMPHNIDFHAVYGPGGGANDTTIAPGESATIEFTAMYPGVHVYHCAVPNMDQHISAGMYGAILVEPEEGLPEVDRELYFGQNEIYTDGQTGEAGHHSFDYNAMQGEDPTYVCLNGEAYAFTPSGAYDPIAVEKGERVRLFFSNGGPNLMSSWHPIGNVWADFYRDGAVANEPEQYVETAPVAPGSVAIGEMDTPVPGPIKIVDHALSRVVNKGMLGVIQVEGEPEPGIYNGDP